MSDGIDLLDISALQPELDAFRSARDQSILEHAKRLMTRLQIWTKLASVSGTGEDWVATRVTLPAGEQTITCWNEAAQVTLIANWNSMELESLIVDVAGRYWASRTTRHGQSLVSHDPEVEGSADRRPFANLERRSREEMERWTRQHPPAQRWACANCAWQNEPEDVECLGCGLPDSRRAGSSDTLPTITEELPLPDEAPRSDVMTLPPGMEDILRSLVGVATSVPDTSIYEVVLLGFPPERQNAVLAELRDTLHASAAYAETLLATMPARIAGELSVNKARDLSEKFEALGARIEIRKSRA